MLLAFTMGRHPVAVEMGILGTVLTNNCGRRFRRECVTRRYMKKVRTTYALATYIPVAHGGSAQDQTIGNLDGTTSNYWNATISVRFRNHSAKKKRV